MPTVLQMIDAFPPIALPKLIPHQPRHHHAHPLLPDDRVLRLLQTRGVVIVDAVKGRWDGWLSGEEGGGFGSWQVWRKE